MFLFLFTLFKHAYAQLYESALCDVTVTSLYGVWQLPGGTVGHEDEKQMHAYTYCISFLTWIFFLVTFQSNTGMFSS